MAAAVSHLTANQQLKPSIFELVAADSLNATFQPAIKRLCNFIVERNPEKYAWLFNYFDEIYLIFNTVLQSYYLRYHDGTLSEVFYGMSRISTKSGNFHNRHRALSILSVVLLPYFKSKLDALVEKYENELTPPKHIEILSKSLTVSTSLLEFAKLVQYIRYISNKTPSHSPAMRLFQLGLVYQSSNEDPKWNWSDLIRGKVSSAHVLSDFLFRGLELSAFFLQFMQWWQTQSHTKNIGDLPIPPAPDVRYEGERYGAICPICLQAWSMPTVVSISGFVFCYKCIIIHLGKSETCPVTRLPATIESLIRIYEN